jgi:hypothetical protein
MDPQFEQLEAQQEMNPKKEEEREEEEEHKEDVGSSHAHDEQCICLQVTVIVSKGLILDAVYSHFCRCTIFTSFCAHLDLSLFLGLSLL